jgi:hypothetical protein
MGFRAAERKPIMLKKIFGSHTADAKPNMEQATGDESLEHDSAGGEGARMGREGQGDMAPQDQRWFADDAGPDASYHPDPPNRNTARDEGRSLEEEARILADNLIGQKATTEGTAGADGRTPPMGEDARTGRGH